MAACHEPHELHTLVDDLVVIHGETLPLALRLPNTNAPPEVVHDAAQVLNYRLLFHLNLRHQPFVTSLAAAQPARRQGRERSGIAATQLAS